MYSRDQVEVELESQPLSRSYPNGDRLRQAVPEGSVAGPPSLPPPFLWKKGKRGALSRDGLVWTEASEIPAV